MIVVTPGGDTIDIGKVENTPTIGIIDYSRRVTDDFGVTTVVERGFARRMSVRLAVPAADTDAIHRQLTDLRAKAALWVADDRFASLSVRGFYKDFSIDLPSAPISYCTLTVEGLTVTEPLTDTGADPAPEGASSTLQMLAPVAITNASFVSSNVAEDDQAEWSATVTYPMGARVMKAATHRVYESVAASNVGSDPAGTSGKWTDVGPTKRWAMFDQALGTVTTAANRISVVLASGDGVNGLALLDTDASSVTVLVGDGGPPIYAQTVPVAGPLVTFLDLPPVPGQLITVTVEAPAGRVASIGTLMIGRVAGLGITEAAPTAAITDYSRKVVDDFGDVAVVERAFAKRMTARALIRTEALDDVAGRIAAVRARPSLWIGQTGRDALTVYGFFKDFSIEVGQSVSKLSLTIEGLSKAPPQPKPLTSIVAQGSVDGINWHLGLQSGDIFMRISNDSGKTFGDAVRVAGRDAFTAYLTNSDHTLPALYDGTVTSYAGAETVFVVGIAGQDLTDSGLFDLSIVANPQNLTVAISGRYFRVDGGLDAGEDSATLTARLTGKGQFAGVTLDQVFSLAKSKGGANGAPAALITLDASALTLRADTSGNYIVGQSFVFTATRTNLPGTTRYQLLNVNGAILVDATAAEYAQTAVYYTSTGPDNLTITPQGAVDIMNVHGGAGGKFALRVYVAGSPVADTVSIQKVQDGAKGADGTSPYNAILSNESHTLPADATGNVLSYAGAEFAVTVFYGAQDVTDSFRLDSVDNPQGLGYASPIPPPTYPSYVINTGFDAGEPSASVTYNFIGKDGTPHAGKRVSKVFSLSKSLGGSNGAPAAIITLDASALTLRAGTDGNYIAGQSFVFTATRTNLPGTTRYQLLNINGSVLADATAAEYAQTLAYYSSTGPDNLTITPQGAVDIMNTHGGAGGKFGLRAYVAGSAVADTVSIQKVQDGAKGADGVGAFTAYLTNSDHTVPASFDGTVASYAGAETVFAIRLGALDLTDSGQFDLSIVANPQNLVIATSGRYFRVDGGLDTNEDGATITARLTGSGQYAGVVLDQVFTLSKSKGGRNGEPSPLIRVDATAMTLRAGTDGNFFGGQRIDLTATRTFMPGTTIWQLLNAAGSVVYAAPAATYAANFPIQWGSDGPDSLYLTQQGAIDNMNAHGGTAGRFSLRVYVDGYSPTDTVSIQKVQDGAKGADAPLVKTQWSIDGATNWHDNYMGADLFYRQSNDGGLTYGSAIRGVGESGTGVGVAFKRSATAPATPATNTGNPPSGWSDGPPAGTDFLWLTKANFLNSVQQTAWSAPQRISGEDGFSVDTETPYFGIPVYSNGTPKPSWTGGAGSIRLRKGGALISAGVTYSVEGVTNIASLTLNGATFSFAGLTADTGKFTIVATYQGNRYTGEVNVKKTYDGAAAFRGGFNLSGSGSFTGEVGIGTGDIPVPGGSTATISATATYAIQPSGTGNTNFTGRLYLYAQNISDGGSLTLLGTSDGSLAQQRNNGTAQDPDMVYTPGVVSASFSFASAADLKTYRIVARLVRIGGGASVDLSGNARLEMTA